MGTSHEADVVAWANEQAALFANDWLPDQSILAWLV